MDRIPTIRQTALRCLSAILIVTALLSLGPADTAHATTGVAVGSIGESTTGRTSTVLERLKAASDRASGTVHITWQGQIERARLSFSVGEAGTPPQAAHTIFVNGQPAALAPVADSHEGAVDPNAPQYHYLEFSPELVVQGDNEIQLTDDALPGDRWTASHIRLQLFGQFVDAPAFEIPALDDGQDAPLVANEATEELISFVNPYDASNQPAMIQIPTGYSPSSPTPLVLYAHGRSSTMEEGIDYLGDAADARGWLVASPELHGSWDVPAICYRNPETCEYEDQVVVSKPGAYAHASLESQYDIIGAAQYMSAHYNVDPSRIYMIGGSMGGQLTAVVAAKFPHMFAAVHAWKSITNLEQWYNEMGAFERTTLQKECHIEGDPKTPAENPFCYERRSGVYLASNYINVPISMTHSYKDTLVPISHSEKLRDRINSFSPIIPCVLYVDWSAAWKCTAPWHCVDPQPAAVLTYLANFTRNTNPNHIYITADESKAYYWMKVTQTGGDHWSTIEVTRDPSSPTIQVRTEDTRTMSLGFNLGSGSMQEYVTSQPGLGFPVTTYLVKGAGHNYLADYSSGYLTTQINLTGENTLTISALEIQVDADPAVVMEDQAYTSTITVEAHDQNTPSNPVPDGTSVLLQTTEGRFPNGSKIYALTTTNGRVTTTLTMQPTDDLAEITATVGKATGTGTVEVLHTGLRLDITPDDVVTYAGVPVSLEYRVTNNSGSTVHAIVVTDDEGNSGGGSYTVCSGRTLEPGAATTCQRSIALSHTAIVSAQVTGLNPGDEKVSGSDGARITVINPSIALTSSPNPLVVGAGASATLTYRVTNTGDATLTAVKVVDDNGGGGSYTSCSGRTLGPGATTTCTRSVNLDGKSLGTTFTYVATATGKDPLNNTVQIQTQTTVMPGSRTYLPYLIRSR